jgi:low temperature requirement protein LtrA
MTAQDREVFESVTVEITQMSLMRVRRPHEHHRVTYVELLFDLVFVFAVTQISHTLLADPTALGLVHTTLLFLAMWWVWIYTSWITNWLDPERLAVRLMLFALMLGGLVLSTSIPKAFDSRGLAFAIAYTGMQVGRTVFMFFAVPASEGRLRRNFTRILIYLLISSVFWLLGALAEAQARLYWWIAALLVEFISPYANFWVPGLGASAVRDWTVEGGHMAERCALFIIIALGESIVVTGAAFAGLAWTHANIGAFASAFAASLAMWWIYFHKGAEASAENITTAADPGRIARLAYTYLHMPIVAGVIVGAVGDDLALTHPYGPNDLKTVLSLVGGPLLFLIGTILFKRTIHGWFQLSHMVGIVLLLPLLWFGGLLTPLMLSAVTTGVLVVVGIWEAVSIGSKATLRRKELVRAQRVNGEHSL